MKSGTILVVTMVTALFAATAVQAACVKKAGAGWGVTKTLAEINAIGAVKMVTGNWPVPTDKISATYKCAPGTVGWNCKAYATVCKS